MTPDSANQNIEIPQNFRFPISDHIEIPAGLEPLSQPHQSAHGTAFLDRERNLVYRKMELGRGKGGNEDNEIEDFWRKIEISMTDKTGLTPRIHRYDPKNFILEMEYIEGTRLDKLPKNQLTIETARTFLNILSEFHDQNLYHGDLALPVNLILDTFGKIRMIDSTYTNTDNELYSMVGIQEVDDDPPSNVFLQKLRVNSNVVHHSLVDIQKADVDLLKDIFLRQFKITEANITGKLVELSAGRTNNIKFKLDTEVDQNDILFVYQRGIGFAGGEGEKRYMETSDFAGEKPMFNSGVTVVVRDPLSNKTALVHADTLTDMSAVKQQIEKNIEADILEVSIIGGETDYSEEILREINDKLSTIRGVKLIRQDTLGERGRSGRQVIVDTETGEITVLYSGDTRNFKPQEELERVTSSDRRNILGQSEKGLALDSSI